MRKYLSPDDVAGRLGVQSKTVRDWLRKGELRGLKAGRLWRITEEALQEFLENARPGQMEVPIEESKQVTRAQAMDKIKQQMKKEFLAEIKAKVNGKEWSVKIEKRAGEYFTVSGRGSAIDFYLVKTSNDYLVAIPYGCNCAGYVPWDVNGEDVMEYVKLENGVDAVTVAAAVRWLIENGHVFRLSR